MYVLPEDILLPAAYLPQTDASVQNWTVSTDAAQGLIVGVAVTQEPNDSGQLLPAVDRLEQRLEKKPQQLVADSGYTTRENIEKMAGREIDFLGTMRYENVPCDANLPNQFPPRTPARTVRAQKRYNQRWRTGSHLCNCLLIGDQRGPTSCRVLPSTCLLSFAPWRRPRPRQTNTVAYLHSASSIVRGRVFSHFHQVTTCQFYQCFGYQIPDRLLDRFPVEIVCSSSRGDCADYRGP